MLEGGIGEAILGATLLLTGGLIASAVLIVGEAAPQQGYLAYAAAILWALIAVVVNQYDASILTTGATLVAAVPVALVVTSKLFGGRPRRRTKRARSSNTPA